jgi:PII-like signaling protein
LEVHDLSELNGESVLVRIFIGESDKYQGRPLYQWIVEALRREGIAGATVLRGVLGFGASSHVHTANILRLSQDLPIVVEFIDSQDNVNRMLPRLEDAMGGGLITVENVKVLRYSAKPSDHEPKK